MTSRDARAVNGPLDAVLMGSSPLTHAVIELREVLEDVSDPHRIAPSDPSASAGAGSASDAGASGVVGLNVDDDAAGAEGVSLCLARPLEPLKPNTRGAWHTNVVNTEGYAPGYFEGEPREFTTGGVDGPLSADSGSIVLLLGGRRRPS